MHERLPTERFEPNLLGRGLASLMGASIYQRKQRGNMLMGLFVEKSQGKP